MVLRTSSSVLPIRRAEGDAHGLEERAATSGLRVHRGRIQLPESVQDSERPRPSSKLNPSETAFGSGITLLESGVMSRATSS